ncbi:Ig-like domain-containing protein [Flavivirga abyssicola]|uniref:Ig-like domain-containing protein n=1 Tax=Flavivirga abyssicola TaxID=3063533 RepID=UPI0026E09C11|nr:Ig-like domain-containing protein [Flavivirga sp. MEBiC07777]WVK14831.1 Ig-like domain-containing protein [Flavivirga sp. MEBiC07777]
MKNITFTYTKIICLLGFMFTIVVSCERELSDEAVFATFPNTAEVFTDAPVGLGTNFYFPYIGSKATAWTVDDDVSYEGTASMRFDVPNANDPDGNFAGAIFRIDGDGSGRDLSGFDALTFWAKASQAVTIGEFGFGEDFGENKYVTTRTNIDLTTNWVKYVVPIPDPSKLIQERGLLRYSAGGIGPVGSEVGYTFWIDEVKFEKLGTVAQPQPVILSGQDVEQQSFNGSQIDLAASGLTQTFNANGRNVTVNTAPAYFTFTSSEPSVASVDEKGLVTVNSQGTASITAVLAGVEAKGSLKVTSNGGLQPAPTPTLPESNVISIFSDAYTNIPVDFYNGNFQGQGTTGGVASLGNDNILLYNNFDQDFGFVTTQFVNPTVNLTSQNRIHFDLYIQESIDSGDQLTVELVNAGSDGVIEPFVDNGGGLSIPSSELTSGTWMSFDLSLDNFTNPTGGNNFSGGIANRAHMGSITFVSGLTLSSIIVDNIYFYTE